MTEQRDIGAHGRVLIYVERRGTLTELANWVAGAPMPMPGNYDVIRLWGMNPYDPRDSFNDGCAAMSTARSSSASIAAKPGYPTVIVPFGMVPNASQPP